MKLLRNIFRRRTELLAEEIYIWLAVFLEMSKDLENDDKAKLIFMYGSLAVLLMEPVELEHGQSLSWSVFLDMISPIELNQLTEMLNNNAKKANMTSDHMFATALNLLSMNFRSRALSSEPIATGVDLILTPIVEHAIASVNKSQLKDTINDLEEFLTE